MSAKCVCRNRRNDGKHASGIEPSSHGNKNKRKAQETEVQELEETKQAKNASLEQAVLTAEVAQRKRAQLLRAQMSPQQRVLPRKRTSASSLTMPALTFLVISCPAT